MRLFTEQQKLKLIPKTHGSLSLPRAPAVALMQPYAPRLSPSPSPSPSSSSSGVAGGALHDLMMPHAVKVLLRKGGWARATEVLQPRSGPEMV